MIRAGLIGWAFTLGLVSALVSQEPHRGAPAPVQFLAMLDRGTAPVPVEANQVAVLRRKVSVRFAGATLEQALVELGRQARLTFAYSKTDVPVGQRVTLRAERMTVAAVLTELLIDAGVDVVVTSEERLILTSRQRGRTVAVTQTGSLVGRVTETNTGSGVAGAEVFLERTQWKATTDASGRYRLSDVDAGSYTLAVRRLGYGKQNKAVTVRDGGVDTADVVLEPAATRLNQLVSTATGRQRRLDIPNDITTINADSVMRAAPIQSVTDLLEHRVPGLTVQRTSGAPGDPARLRLRGAGSPLQNNDPVVVVDGVRVYAQQSDARSANLAGTDNTAQFAAPSPLDYIDPNSIETIEVVKGASATTLWGPDAANGVLVITTKKGRAGPTRWELAAIYGRTKIAGQYPDLLLARGHRLVDQEPVFCPRWRTTSEEPCAIDSVSTFQLLNDPALTVLDRGHNGSLSLNASGGTKTLTYSITGSYKDALGYVKLPGYEIERYQTLEGTTPPDWMERPQWYKQWGARTTIDARLGATASVTLTTSLSRTKQQRSTLEQQLGQLTSVFLDRSTGVYYAQGFPGGIPQVLSTFAIDNYRTRGTDAATQFVNSVNASWQARPWLMFSAVGGLDVQQRSDELFVPTPRDSLRGTGRLNFATGTVITSTVNAGATAMSPLGHGFQLRFASGVSYIGRSISDGLAQTDHVPYGTSLVGTLNAVTPTRYLQDDATFGWYVEPALMHPRFALNLGLQLNGGSSYGSKVSGFKLPSFPKLGFSYLLSDEPWFPFKSVFQSFRVRTSYGRAGRQPGPTERLRLYGVAQQALGNQGVQSIVELQYLGNTDLRPERTSEVEGGFDADFLDNRLTVTLSAYHKTTDDALLPIPLPPSVYGNDVSITRNIGVIRNTGINVSAAAQLVRTAGMVGSMQVTLTQNRNMVVRLAPGVDPFYTQGSDLAGGTRVAAGYPLFGRWARPIAGYADTNGNGVLEAEAFGNFASEIIYGDTAVYAGRTEPNYELTVQPTVSLWHGALTVGGVVAHTGGLSQNNELAQRLKLFSRGTNDPTALLDAQLATGTNRFGDALGGIYTQIQTVSTTRFASISVRYAVPKALARRVGAQNLSLALQGQNLGLWTNYRGFDPNVNAFSTGNSVTDTGVLPMPRLWQIQINASY